MQFEIIYLRPLKPSTVEVISNRFYGKQQGGKNRDQSRLSKAHDPPATMKYMPEQPLTGAIRLPINKINLPRYTSHGISPQISNNCGRVDRLL